MPQKTTRTRNWKDYNRSSIKSGAITLWIAPDLLINSSSTSAPTKRGRPRLYPDSLIEAALLIKQVYHLSFRQVQGFLDSLSQLTGVKAAVPNYTTLCRRQATLLINLAPGRPAKPLTLVIDSTGLKVIGEGEWCRKKHGVHYQRTWKKVHLAVDADGLDILSCAVSGSRIQDADMLEPLLNDIKQPISKVIGDGAYDTFKNYETVFQRQGVAIFPPRVDAQHSSKTRADKKAACAGAIAQRDEAIITIGESDKATWKKQVGYHRRSLAETTMYRLKTRIGERLAAKTAENQALEVALKCKALNKMNQISSNQYIAS